MSKLCVLNDFGFLRVSGKDAVSFMQGYTTCDLVSLGDNKVQLGAVCNIQGRMLTSFFVLKEHHNLIFRMHRDLVPATIEFLSKYIVFSKAELSDMSEKLHCFGLVADSPEEFGSVTQEGDGFTVHLGNRSERWLPTDMPAPESDQNIESWQTAELEAGQVWVSVENSEKFLPQMFNYHTLDGIDFNKGCYLGQEIVARMQYRGELKRKLHSLHSEKHRTKTDPLTDGEIVSVAGLNLLAVIKNPTDEPITVNFEDGEELLATLIV